MNSIKIESTVPAPQRKFALHGKLAEIRSALAKMKPGESFVWEHNKAPFDAAKQLNIKIKTRKIDGNGYRVWRVE